MGRGGGDTSDRDRLRRPSPDPPPFPTGAVLGFLHPGRSEMLQPGFGAYWGGGGRLQCPEPPWYGTERNGTARSGVVVLVPVPCAMRSVVAGTGQPEVAGGRGGGWMPRGVGEIGREELIGRQRVTGKLPFHAALSH